MNLSTNDAHTHPRRMTRRSLRGFDAAAFATLRRRSGLSADDLATRAGLSFSTIHHWESGRRTPQIDVLARVMDLLQAPIEQVVPIPPQDRYPSDWRVMKGLTQGQLAQRADLSTSTIQRIEDAVLPLPDAHIDLLAGLLDISPDQFRTAYRNARERPPGTPA